MNNEPAFPRPHSEPPHYAQEGMTLRDYFAAKAMTITEFHRCTYADGTRIRDDQAEWCYEVADAMIRARGRTE
jgi:hypothetical protein